MLQFTMIFLTGRVAKARRLAREDQLGASVLEWALIAAISVAAAVALGVIVTRVVGDKGANMEDCATNGKNCD